jgi:putative Mn2+ efflux pump MntP
LDITLLVEILGLAVALAMDAFAVSCGVGLAIKQPTGRQKFRLSWHFGLFQFLMPLVGWAAGHGLSDLISGFGKWLAFAILLLLGAKMSIDGLLARPVSYSSDPTRGASLVLLSIAVSIDALAVGFSLSLLGIGVFWPSIVIGLIAGGFTLVGLRLGASLAGRFERAALITGGVILIAIGIKSLF